MKEQMIEAVKRKRAMIQQYEEDSKGPHAEGQSAKTGDDELAPAGGSSKNDALLGKESNEYDNTSADARSIQENNNQNAMGNDGDGFQGGAAGKASAPENSKPLFHDPKKDTHDDADPNMDRNMAGGGGGLETKYDKMGVNDKLEPRLQSSNMAKENMSRAASLKARAAADVGNKQNVNLRDPGPGKDVPDAPRTQEIQGFSPEKANEEHSGLKGAGFGLKGARAKLDGYLSKLKRS